MKNTIPVPKLSRATVRRTWSRPVLLGLVLASVLAMPVTARAHDHTCRDDHGPVAVAYDPWLTEVVTYYGHRPVVVERFVRAGWSSNDIAVAVFLANRSGVSLDVVFEYRRGGRDWYDVANQCRVSPVVFITPVASPHDACGVYARPYASWARHPRGGWRFSDAEARELVYLRFAHDRYGCEPRWVMHERNRGRAWSGMPVAWREHHHRDRNHDHDRYADRDESRSKNVKNAKKQHGDRDRSANTRRVDRGQGRGHHQG